MRNSKLCDLYVRHLPTSKNVKQEVKPEHTALQAKKFPNRSKPITSVPTIRYVVL